MRTLAAPTPVPALQHQAFDPADVKLQPEGRTVEQNWILDLYTFFHSKDFDAYRVVFPGTLREDAVAHLLIPAGEGPHPLVMVFPILEGSHVVSEGLAKALVNRGYLVARLERVEFDLAEERDPAALARSFRGAVLDARRLLDWLVTRSEIDAQRIATAGVSTGAVLALLLMEIDPRVRAGFFLMPGGGLPEILWDSSEKPIKTFRKRLRAAHGLETRERWTEFLTPHLRAVDPLTYADRVDPRQLLLISGRFDRVIRPDHTRRLWEGLGRPTWKRFPAGHYQLFPYFWWAVGRGAAHLDAYFEGM